MKKLLSLALALTLCLSLNIPALAVNQPGDTTITDSKDNTYILTTPILFTISPKDLNNIKVDFSNSEDFYTILDNVTTIYAVPAGMEVTMPHGIKAQSLTAVDITWENGICHATEMSGKTDMDWDFVNISATAEPQFGFIDCYSSGRYVNTIAFFITDKNTQTNPFTTSTPTNPTTPSKPAFIDVAANAYYADAVAYAVEKGITSGTSATTFSPNENCTRAQIITFLWRAAGSPEPKNSPAFTDVKADAYYAKATAWAAENGMTSGDVFAPDSPCTREMAVVFMWKYAGNPDAAQASFTDVSSAAVNWAVETGVTSGTSSTTFSPDNICTRAQIVTFLYRAFAE